MFYLAKTLVVVAYSRVLAIFFSIRTASSCPVSEYRYSDSELKEYENYRYFADDRLDKVLV